MKRLLVLLAFFACSVIGDSASHLQYFWISDLSTLAIAPGSPRHEGVMVFITDDSTETTHYHVTVEYISRSGSPAWLDRIAEKYRTHPKGLTPVLLESPDVAEVTKVIVIAMKVTGYREGLIGFDQQP